jgi:hypothetical protein
MTNHWMVRGNVTFTDWTQHVGAGGFVNPTPILDNDACTVCNGGTVASNGGIAGYINAKWAYSITSAVELPKGINFGAALVGRQGYIIPYYRRVNPGDGSGNQRIIVSESFGSDRLPDLFNLDLRAAKEFSLTAATKLNVSIDLFNVTNERTVLWRENRLFVAAGNNAQNNRILQLQSPRVWRLGARLSF